MIKAIIWDMDGVLSDSEPLWEKVIFTYLKKKGVAIPKNFDDIVVRHMKGRDLAHVTRFTKKHFKLKDTLRGIHHERMRLILKLIHSRLRAVPYARETLQRLSPMYIQALVSSAPRSIVRATIAKLKFKGYFDYVLAGDEVRIAKPNPYIFLKAARKLKVKPAECLVVEDSLAGVQAAKRARMTCVLLKTAYTLPIQRKMAHVVISSLRALPKRLERLATSS